MTDGEIVWLFMGIILGACIGIFLPEGIGNLDSPRICTVKTDEQERGAIDRLDLTAAHSSTVERRPLDADSGSTPQAAPSDYSVTGTPRHIPWSRRKKELEQAARQKRRHLESFREEA